MNKYRIINLSQPLPGENDWFAAGYGEHIDREILNHFYTRISAETDRGLVVLTAALLDDLTEQKLRTLFSHGNKEARERLFDALGPFSSSASKIDALFCLGGIGPESRSNMHIIRKLRNHCAHQWDDFRLDEATDNRFMSNLTVPEFFTNLNGAKDHLPLHPKSKFTIAAFMVVLLLNIDKIPSATSRNDAVDSSIN